eukprot:XP_014788792.1 PREDICTED: threonine--tRNA ligase, cytoplasmic-like [Octopus bimaculoides]
MLSWTRLSSLSQRIGLRYAKTLTRASKNTKKSKEDKNKNNTCSEVKPPPDYIQTRLDLWNKWKESYNNWLAAQPSVDITITLPDGKEVKGQSWRTTPYEIAKGISQGLADNTVISKVNDELWDIERPLEKDCTIKFLKFDDDEGKQVFWHSSAHILGEAMELKYGGHLCYGPPIEGGFYYDMFIDDGQVSSNDYNAIETAVKSIVKEKQPFERLEVKKEDLLEMFKYNKFKQRILNEKVTTPTTTIYRCGSLIDLCRGPHIRHTGKVKALAVTKNSSTYWEGKAEAESLNRIYGISFPEPKQMKEWKHLQEEAAKRDHRKIGREQELFFFHEQSPGSCFFLPKGAHIYNKLIEFIKENMFSFQSEKETFALKPMNCPGHCLMFDHRPRSWKELPLRLADFGVLHRNELSGALSGLTRVRRFQQDDAHIFCRQDQIKEEISGCLDFLKNIYGIFGFMFNLKLSTRPEKYMGALEMWNEAEKVRSHILGFCFIDITILDALQRPHQCATIQLDFQLPLRFNLSYISGEGGDKKTPVIVHRAIFGSVERMIAILCENYAGKWPFWLSPRQSIVVPVAPPFDDYAQLVSKQIHDAGFICDVDLDPGTTMNKKIRNAQLAQYNFIFVVGEKEVQNLTTNVRTRDNKVHGEHSIVNIIERFKDLNQSKILDAEEKF